MTNKIWFITGTSSGFGKIWTIAALRRGDKVIATVRNLSDARYLEEYGENAKVLQLDVNNRADCFEATDAALAEFGRIDVFVNNAGYGQFGMLEEMSEEEIRSQMETNVFGSIWMLQAITPIFRQQKKGHIIQLSSIGGLLAFPGVSMYNATKFAMEGICDALYQEVKDFGVHLTLIEPAGFATDFGGRSARTAFAKQEYDAVREKRKKASTGNTVGDAQATADIVLKLVDSNYPPLRLLMGKNTFERVEKEYENRISEWKEWYLESREAHGE